MSNSTRNEMLINPKIVAGIDEELEQLENRIAKLRELRRFALDLDADRRPARPPSTERRARPVLSDRQWGVLEQLWAEGTALTASQLGLPSGSTTAASLVRKGLVSQPNGRGSYLLIEEGRRLVEEARL